jgi:hypothetical protein
MTMNNVVHFGRRHGRAVFYAARRIMPEQGWKRARWVVICEYDGALVAWWPGPADKKTAQWLAGVHAEQFKKGRALMTRRESQFIITIEDDTRQYVFWTGEDYDAARVEFDQLEGHGVILIDLTEAA